jgi:hypothetical protein
MQASLLFHNKLAFNLSPKKKGLLQEECLTPKKKGLLQEECLSPKKKCLLTILFYKSIELCYFEYYIAICKQEFV